MNKKTLSISTIAVLAIVLLFVIEQFIQASYVVKTGLKVLLLLIIPLAWAFMYERSQISTILGLRTFRSKELLPGLLIGAGSFIIIIAAYAILGPFIDFSNIAHNLETKLGINASNFLFVGLYVIFINSLLEEFFFRGFMFLNLKDRISVWTAYILSAGAFAIYHVAIIKGWFNPALMALALLSLFVIGLVFNKLNSRSGHFLNSWIAHAMADSAIILVGCRIFGIL
ncbi:MAG: CAAX amino terminal protease family protein [Parcubacteria bacterium C7867-007]|nr:MAG: CAAX amino terminal protease family protein [Parcubacteria bacterium C7867-007]